MSSIRETDRVSLCTFTFTDGRRCRTPRQAGHPSFCYFHARKEAQARTTEAIGAEIAELLSTGYLSAGDVSLALGRLFAAVAQGHIKPRQARTLAYLGQVLVQAVQLQHKEFIDAFGTTLWRQLIHNSFARDLSTPPRSAIRSAFRFASPPPNPQPSQSPAQTSAPPPPPAAQPPAAPASHNPVGARYVVPTGSSSQQAQRPNNGSTPPSARPPEAHCSGRLLRRSSSLPKPQTHHDPVITLESTLAKLFENKPL